MDVNSSNDNDRLIDELADLLNETAEAHHKAFAAIEGDDPDWPIWYTDYLLEKMRQMLKAKFTKGKLIYLLVLMDKQNGSVAPGAYWPRFCCFLRNQIEAYRTPLLLTLDQRNTFL